MIKAIIFDLGEVILQGLLGVETHLNEKYGLKLERGFWDIEELNKLFHGQITEEEYWKAIIKHYGWQISVDELKNATRQNFRKIEGTEDIIHRLKKEGYKLGLLSVHTKEWIRYCEETYGYHKLFDSLSYSFEVAVSKPDRKAYETILQKLQLKPEECVFVDDKLENIEAAQKLGIHGIQFKDHIQLQKDLKKLRIRLD